MQDTQPGNVQTGDRHEDTSDTSDEETEIQLAKHNSTKESKHDRRPKEDTNELEQKSGTPDRPHPKKGETTMTLSLVIKIPFTKARTSHRRK